MNKNCLKKIYSFLLSILLLLCFVGPINALDKKDSKEKRQEELRRLQEHFQWWPTDAMPGPVKDEERGGYWWWPTTPGSALPWGNRGYIYVYKIIYDYKAEEVEEELVIKQEEPETIAEVSEIEISPAVPELKPSLLIKKIIKNVKIYFDYNKAELREDHMPILEQTVKSLKRNPETSIIITGNCDKRGSDEYNLKLGKKRSEVVKQYMLERGLSEDRIFIVSRGKLDAVAPLNELVGMQKDRNAQFMVAEVEEIMIPEFKESDFKGAKPIEERKYLIEKEEKLESAVKVSTKEYIVQKGDSLSKIAQRELGGGHRWKYLYELNKDRIKDPNRLRVGQKIIIPVE